ncbi:hypothetical protein [Atlantibacter sp.]|uniref:hypothetical protein n=1 Tax=Atlantibacter sp. TaxID=1903473 RepID=UPI00289C6F93|nr:hypothetical protein [Atlantibacter sp.]
MKNTCSYDEHAGVAHLRVTNVNFAIICPEGMAKALFTFLQSSGGLSSFTASACLWMLGNASDVIGDIPPSCACDDRIAPRLIHS